MMRWCTPGSTRWRITLLRWERTPNHDAGKPRAPVKSPKTDPCCHWRQRGFDEPADGSETPGGRSLDLQACLRIDRSGSREAEWGFDTFVGGTETPGRRSVNLQACLRNDFEGSRPADRGTVRIQATKQAATQSTRQHRDAACPKPATDQPRDSAPFVAAASDGPAGGSLFLRRCGRHLPFDLPVLRGRQFAGSIGQGADV